METAKFVHSLRQEALQLGDYNAYRQLCSRRLARLRKQLGRVQDPKKEAKPEPVTAIDIARDRTHVYLVLYYSERAWAHGMHMKTISADLSPETTASRDMKNHIRSRFHKAASYVLHLRDLYFESASGATPTDIVEAVAYAASLCGAEAFEKGQWEVCLRQFAVSRAAYDALATAAATASGGEMYREFLVSVVDPSIRYAAYQLEIPRTAEISALARQFFPSEGGDWAIVRESVEKICPRAFKDTAGGSIEAAGESSEGAEPEVKPIHTANWRGREAKIENVDTGVALGMAQQAEEALRKDVANIQNDAEKVATAFDKVLSPWQDAVDYTKKDIDKLVGQGVGAGDSRLQNLQVVYTYTSYWLLSWRCGRNRMLAEQILGRRVEEGKVAKPGRRAPRGGERGGVAEGRELLQLFDGIVQSLDQIAELPGIAADEEFMRELEAKRLFFSAIKCSTIASTHTDPRNSLALYARSLTYLLKALPILASLTPKFNGKGENHPLTLTIPYTTSVNLHKNLEAKVQRYTALCNLTAEDNKLSGRTSSVGATKPSGESAPALPPVVITLNRYRDEKDVDLTPGKGGLVGRGVVGQESKGEVEPVPAKPVFFDVAWNFVEYGAADADEREKKADVRPETQPQPQRKGGFLGGLFGR